MAIPSRGSLLIFLGPFSTFRRPSFVGLLVGLLPGFSPGAGICLPKNVPARRWLGTETKIPVQLPGPVRCTALPEPAWREWSGPQYRKNCHARRHFRSPVLRATREQWFVPVRCVEAQIADFLPADPEKAKPFCPVCRSAYMEMP